MLLEEGKILGSVKGLFQVFTNKILFLEWICEVLRAVSIYFLKMKAGLEADEFAEVNEQLDMRTAPPAVNYNVIHDEEVLKARWDLCSSCEVLTDANKCEQCGCFMKFKTKVATSRCPIGKWEKEYEFIKGQAVNGTHATTEL